jgi:hypothetical protein
MAQVMRLFPGFRDLVFPPTTEEISTRLDSSTARWRFHDQIRGGARSPYCAKSGASKATEESHRRVASADSRWIFEIARDAALSRLINE